ncbi:Coiled-coil domain-containing protein [Dirofilaria immitis]
MLDEKLVFKIICAVGLFFIAQVAVFWMQLQNLDEKKFMLVAEIDTLIRKREELNKKIWMQEKETYRMEGKLQRIHNLVRDRIPLAEIRKSLPFIYFITPTYRRPTQKADLIRLAQTLAHVPNLHWIVVEDANNISPFIADIFKRYHIRFTHLYALTPPEKKPNETDPNWKVPRGVVQRNKALLWLRKNLHNLRRGVVYFGDDDNTYDWRLFDEMRTVERVGVWPVGLVGGLIVEMARLSEDKNVSFNSLWKPERPFPIDMAAFAINLSLALDANAFFTYDVPRGYQESHFLTTLGLKRSDLELKADGCTKVYVWHTRTERALLSQPEKLKFWQGLLNNVETDADMGERKGQNFYYPPDFDYKKHKSLNSYHGTHALRERAAKIKQGILIIRFEMPFNIWCLGCNNHVGMGVRYNAEKKKIGMYYTTPLYEFRMKCHLCSNYFVIRTDPEHFDYELVEGCRRQEKRYDPSTIDQLGAVDRGFNRQLEGDRMFQVEHVEKDKEKAASSADKIGKLEWIQERMRDDFAANQALRRSFKLEKGNLREGRIRDEDLLKRMSLNIKLVPESIEDKKLAAAVLRYKKMKFTF